LNPGPLPYQGSALPLSYIGAIVTALGYQCRVRLSSQRGHATPKRVFELLYSPSGFNFLPVRGVSMTKLYEFSVNDPMGQAVSLEKYRGKVLLVVNVASKCGFTPQYTGLEAMYEKYKAQGFEVLAFPCNQFGAQEPGTDAEIGTFCTLNYGVKFPIFQKIDVNGADAHPLYAFLKKEEPGVLGTELIKWNFTKFLVNKSGEVVERFAPTTTPESLAPQIEELLKSK
jgi:glutathione peroxidase